MAVPKFFVSPEQIQGDEIRITEDAHHIKHVLRMQIGEQLTVCDGQGVDHISRIESMDDQIVVCHIESSIPSQAEPEIHITLFRACLRVTNWNGSCKKERNSVFPHLYRSR